MTDEPDLTKHGWARAREARELFSDLLRPKLPDGRPALTREDLAQTRSSSRWQRIWGWLNRSR